MNDKTLMCITGLLFVGNAYADCPNTLSAEQLAECITVEGAEYNYQDWKHEFTQTQSLDADTTDSESMISQTISNVDIRSVAPAAGSAIQK